MNIETIAIGEYQISPAVQFKLYRVPSPLVTPPLNKQSESAYINYVCIEDLFAIFDLQSIKQDLSVISQYYPGGFFKDEAANRSFIATQTMVDIALKHHVYNLADLCRLSEKELMSGGAIPLLKMTTSLRLYAEPLESTVVFRPVPLTGREWFLHELEEHVKLEPLSPTLSPTTTTSKSQMSTIATTCLSSVSSLPTITMTAATPDTAIALPKPSSLLLKRLAPKHGHKKNLTILTPSYSEDHVGIQSAPLRKPVHHRASKNKIIKKTSPLSKTATFVSAPWPQTSIQARFPSPPIVPSQQPSWAKQYNRPTPLPSHPTQTAKQKFLQPFEFLYDHIEQTRVLKTSLDDQIRRSSNLMQTLQSTNVESMVRRQVRDMMEEPMDVQLKQCTERIARLERRHQQTSPLSPIHSPTQPKDILTQLMNRIDQLETKLSQK